MKHRVSDLPSAAFLMIIVPLLILGSCSKPVSAVRPDDRYPEGELIPFMHRVDIQSEYALPYEVLDGKWVAVGLGKRDYALCIDTRRMYEGEHSYRFELRGAEDNTLGAYGGGKKGRVELSWCYATDKDFDPLYPRPYENAQILKTVYYHGKGFCDQASRMKYRFAIFVPEDMDELASGIFAQWHGMPSRTLTRNPQGEVRELTDEEFIKLSETMIIDDDKGYEKKPNGKKGKENGWRFEQGGYPPMSFAFGKGYFYIQANSDRSWLTDKSIRCNINPAEAAAGDYREAGPVDAGLGMKRSTLAYKMPVKDFPRNCWVTFDIQVDWTKYGKEAETAEGGRLDVVMSWPEPGKKDGPVISRHIVDDMDVLIGRNDHKGYYFKFGIYRADGSEIPVSWSMAGYEEEKL